MSKNENIQQRLEQTMNSLDGMRKASPGPFFFTRVQARLERDDISVWESVTGFLTRPVVATAVVGFIIFMNASVAFFSKPTQTEVSIAEQITQQNLPEEYNYNTTVASLYDYDNNEMNGQPEK